LNFPSKQVSKKSVVSASKCIDCGMLYFAGNADDDSVHSKFHKIYLQKYKNEYKKNQNVLSQFVVSSATEKNLILRIDFCNFMRLKAKKPNILNCCALMDADLGSFVSTSDNDLCLETGQSLYCIVEQSAQNIVGCVVCEPRTFAYKIKCDCERDFVQRTETKRKCHFGVVKIWVHPSFRQKGIGSKLLDAIRKNFIYGTQIETKHIAFCQPTRCGLIFAEKYCQTKEILVY